MRSRQPPRRREYAAIFLLTLAAACVMTVAGYTGQPGYTDAYYYHNAAVRLTQGAGLTDPYVAITYIGARGALPQPGHLYWMPLASLVVAMGVGSPVPWPMVLLWAGLATTAFWCGARLGGTRRHAWVVGLLVIFSGFYTAFWLQPDTFALYGVTGALSLAGMGLGRARRDWRWFACSGALAGLAHLARADGLLLAAVLALASLWPVPTQDSGHGASWRERALHAGAGLLAYALVMAPWLLRNVALGAPPLPAGGLATMWLRSYEEIVNYPPDGLTLQHFLDWGVGNILASRWGALATNVQHFIAEQGLLVLWPFTLIGLWKRRNDPFLSGVWVYALGLHLAMTFAFAYPGMRGGLFHSSTALLPFWFSLGVLGIDDAVRWVAARRRAWNAAQARMLFSGALVVMMAVLSVSLFAARVADWKTAGTPYATLGARLPGDAVVMVNDPAGFYYHTGLPGVVVPNGGVATVRAVAAQYGVTHVILDVNRTPPLSNLFLGREEADFLTEVLLIGGDDDDPANDIRVFEVNLP
ncbi:MAG: hypothetical protein M5R40_11530 [Anaerolineae bacterium]|nr:hypothetical protein [Anaerolineae bacterium]